jgi:hypothetical protein
MAAANLHGVGPKDGPTACTEDSVKYWAGEHDGGRRDPTDLSKTGRLPSDIAEAISEVMSKQPFSSTKCFTAQIGTSRELVKRILIETLEMKKFSLRLAFP